MEEIWKDIKGFEGEYEVSNTGKIKSKKRKNERILIPDVDRYGYLRVCLFYSKGGYIRKKVHRLVAEAFLPNVNELPQVNHKDGDKKNNNVDNLEWCTAKENLRHALETGLRKKTYKSTPHYGEENGNSKITKEIAEEIRNSYISGSREYGCRALARKYGLGVTTVRAIVNYKTWKERKEEI